MTRIIAGSAGGRRIATPSGAGTRPTSDRVREAIFSRLDHLDVLEGAHVLDLYAGSGALGLEALSRGAVSATLVEHDRAAAQVITRNARDLGLGGAVVRRDTVLRHVSAPRVGGAVGVVLVDPPYAVPEEEVTAVLGALLEHDHLTDDAVLVVERSSRSPEPTWPAGIEPLADKRYGETTVWYAERVPVDPA